METVSTYIDFYSGAYGDTIRIHSCSIHWLTLLKGAIEKLYIENSGEVNICKIANVECSDTIDALLLQKEENLSHSVTSQNNEKTIFIWKQDKEEIKTVLGLIDGLIQSNQPGHQYLTKEGSGCIIELSYNE